MSLCSGCRQALRRAVARPQQVASTRAPLSTKPAIGAAAASSSSSSPSSSAAAASPSPSPPPLSVADALSRGPTWSVGSLRDDATASAAASAAAVTPAQLRHLLRLAALPPPRSAADEADMLATLRAQLRFVHALQRVDTAGVAPLRAIRDETDEGARECTLGLAALEPVLRRERRVGHRGRPARVRDAPAADADADADAADAERWDALATAPTRAGRYFVVEGAGAGAS